MKISENKVVSFSYTVKNAAGEVLDQSDASAPFSYLHGCHQIISGLEVALEGKEKDAKFSVHVDPEDAYGVRDESLIFTIDRSYLGDEPIEKGMQLQLQAEDGYHIVTILDITDTEVKLDGNHPLAGESLDFDVQVLDVREATAEEIEHGHSHSHEHDCDCNCEGECDSDDDFDDIEFTPEDDEKLD
ncbi:MAG: peptidylprolyl isomerase [Spirochaetes bacterium]|nr:peptidylprolyl isomerase [Spirochaetota bacterium]NLJ05796.1 peptidylprolyl isomerase [Exilispira sp.]HOV46149.1 peptidylprolyl isomerase [Exilispira sp.]